MPSFQPSARSKWRTPSRLWLGLILGMLALGVSVFVSITQGVADIPLSTIYQALTAFDGSREHLIIRTLRLPRSLNAVTIGASLAVAGGIMQGLTRNPLASPSILGVNAGATLAVVATNFLLGSTSSSLKVTFAFLGAILAAIAIYLLSSLGQDGITPIKLTIAGAALTAFLSSLTTGLLILDQSSLDDLRFWLAGSVSKGDLDLFLQVMPYILIGLLVAFLSSRQITIMTLGEDVAKSLGLQTTWVKIAAAVSVVFLAGSSVAIAGPIGFIGLVIPHIARFLVGVDYRWILPYAAVLGGILLLLADLVARSLIQGQELPVGVMTALIGAPFFIYLVLWQVKR